MQTIYCKANYKRQPRFATKTSIVLNDDNTKAVIKEPLFETGKDNIKRIAQNYELIKDVYPEDMVSECTYENNKLVMKYYEAEFNLGQLIIDYIHEGKKEQLELLLNRWKSIIIGNESNKCTFKMSNDFYEIFGEAKELEDDEAVKISNVDCIPDNILLLKNNKIKIIDYEWTFKISIPTNFILYYGIRTFAKNNLSNLEFNDILELANIDEHKIDTYERLIYNFYNYISKDKKTNKDYGTLGGLFVHPTYDMTDLNRFYRYKLNRKFDKNEKIIVYGAGSVGTDYYTQLKNMDCNIVCWLDQNAEKLQQVGLDVEIVDNINHYSFDYILIAVLYENVANEIKKNIEEKFGIPQEKILWISPIVN